MGTNNLHLHPFKRQSPIFDRSDRDLRRTLRKLERDQTRELERHIEKELDRMFRRLGR